MGTIGSKTNVKKISIKPEKSKEKQPLWPSSPDHLPTRPEAEKVCSDKEVVFEESSLTDTEKLQIRNERSKNRTALKYMPSKETSASREFLLNDDSINEADKSTTTQPERQELEEVGIELKSLNDIESININDHSKRNCPGKYQMNRTLSMVTQVSPKDKVIKSKGDQTMDDGKINKDMTKAGPGQEKKHHRDLEEMNVSSTQFDRYNLREQLILNGAFDSDLVPFGHGTAGTQQNILGHFQLADVLRKPKGTEPRQKAYEVKQPNSVKLLERRKWNDTAADQERILVSLRQRAQELDTLSKDNSRRMGQNAIRTVATKSESPSRNSGGGGGYSMSTCPPVRAPEQERLPSINAHQNKEYNPEFMKTWLRERDKKCSRLLGDTGNSGVERAHGADSLLSSFMGRHGSYRPANSENAELRLSTDSELCSEFVHGDTGSTGFSGVAKHKNTIPRVTELPALTVADAKDGKTVYTRKTGGDLKNKEIGSVRNGEFERSSWSSPECDSDVSASSTAREIFREASKGCQVQIGNLSYANAGRSGFCSVQDGIDDRFRVHETSKKGSRGSKNKRDGKGWKWSSKFSKHKKYRDDFDCREFQEDFDYIFNDDDDIKRKNALEK